MKTIGDVFCDKEGGQQSDQLNRLTADLEASVAAPKVGTSPRWNRPISDGNLKMHLAMREVCTKLTATLFNEVCDLAVMPGIGKSWFVDAFALHLIKRGCAALLECDAQSWDEVAKGKIRAELIVPKREGNKVTVEKAWVDHIVQRTDARDFGNDWDSPIVQSHRLP